MADFQYNIAKGSVAQYYKNIDANDPLNSAFIIVVINTTATDAVLKDLDNLSLVLGDVNTAEVTNTGYARKTLVDTDLAAFAPDDTTDSVKLDFADQTWTSVLAGDAWSDFLVCYDSDTTAGTDANIEVCTQHDFSVTPDGSDVTAQLHADGFIECT